MASRCNNGRVRTSWRAVTYRWQRQVACLSMMWCSNGESLQMTDSEHDTDLQSVNATCFLLLFPPFYTVSAVCACALLPRRKNNQVYACNGRRAWTQAFFVKSFIARCHWHALHAGVSRWQKKKLLFRFGGFAVDIVRYTNLLTYSLNTFNIQQRAQHMLNGLPSPLGIRIDQGKAI